MDLRILVADENGEVLQEFTIYQDGSDYEGSIAVRLILSAHFDIEEEDR